MENNKNNSDWLYSFFTFLTLIFLFFGYLFFLQNITRETMILSELETMLKE